MLTFHEKIIHSCALAGFLCAEIAWHATVYNKDGVLPWGTLMQLAGMLWMISFAVFFWSKRAILLERDEPGIPPWYFFALGAPMCMYVSITPWLLLTAFNAIRPAAIF